MIDFDLRASHRILGTIFVTQSLYRAGFIAMFTLLSVIAADLGGGDKAAGIPSTVNTLAPALMSYPVGIVMGRMGRRSGHTLGYLFGFLGAALGAVAIVESSFLLLLAASFLVGASRTGAEQTRFTVSEIYPENQRASVIGLIIFAGTVGAVFGPLLVAPSGDLVERFGIDAHAGAWILGAVMIALAVVITFIFMRPDPREISRQITNAQILDQLKQANISQQIEVKVRSLREIFSDKTVRLAVVTMMISQSVMVLLMTITSLHMKHHNHSEGAISVVIMAHTLGMFAISPLTGIFIDWLGRINMILVGAVVLIASCVIAPLSTSMPVLVTSLFLLGLGWNFCFISGTSLLSDALTTDERGQAQGVNEMLVAVAAGLGSFSSGFIFEEGGFLLVSLIGLGATLLLTGMVGAYLPRQNDQSMPTPSMKDASY